ncbi:hypothetical protein [Pseudomonas viridiflava]|uniref:hypothetical protein n=1 Tax=Pseudomonas viridiflava TaxID=33069 RepID=UPI00197DA2A4|nr:hypothetical protein [Pseudomonas viridiflava]
MTVSKPQPELTAAEQARQSYRKTRSEGSQTKVDLDQPDVDGVLGLIDGDDRYLWPRTQWGKDWTIRIPNSVQLNPYEQLHFIMNGDRLDIIDLPDPVTPAIRVYVIPAGKFESEGVYKIEYLHANGDGNIIGSASRSVTVDHTAPNGNIPGQAPGLPQDVIDNGLTLAYFDAHATLDISIPRTSDIIAGDEIRVYWGPVGPKSMADPIDHVASITVSKDQALPGAADPVISLDADLVKTLQDGPIAVLYRYVDRSGNLGQPSRWQEIYVDLDPLPESLVAPLVPLANDGLIDRADARLGVRVEIPAPGYGNPQPGKDMIEVNWENTTVPAVPLSTFPMLIVIDWPTLSAEGALDARSFKVSYSVVRGAAKTSSPEIDISVDFTVAGVNPDPDPDPEGPDPINDKLPPVVIKSRGPVDNELSEEDKGLDAKALVTPNPVIAGQSLRLFWGALIPHVDEVVITDPPADPVEFTVPWDKIQQGGYNEQLPVYYSTWNGVNEQQSPRTLVKVTIVESEELADVEFPDRYSGGNPAIPVINCCSKPWDGIKARIPGDRVSFEVGNTVDVSWQAYDDSQGNSPIPGTAYSAPTVTLDDDAVRNGFTITVPYIDYIEPIVTRGSGRVTYVLKKSPTQISVKSTLVVVTRVLPGELNLCTREEPGVCDIPDLSE